MGSPPQIDTIGAPQSSTAARHCSTLSVSLIVDLYSRMRPQPVHVKLQACSGSSMSTMGNLAVPRKRLLAMYRARFAVIFRGYLIHYLLWRPGDAHRPGESRKRGIPSSLAASCGTAKAHTTGNNSDKGDTSNRKRRETRFP